MQTEKKIMMKPENEVYKRIKKLGQGSFGIVYLARCLKSNTLCAVKQIDIKELSEEERKKTLNESKILESLKHPSIINFREVYKTKKGRLCIVMDYADGGDLAKRIEAARAQNSFFSENQILDWFTQICLALKHVHDRKIIHRDLKSSNIFLTKENRIKLGDFGIATKLASTFDKAKTIIGSPYYLSPEIIDNKPYNMKTDIWSLGVILYELCALTTPFDANNLNYLALKIVRGSYTPLNNNVSKEIKNLVGLLLSTDANKRPNINDILTLPVMTNRIKNFLSESMRKIEFSHTIIHNQPNPNSTNNTNTPNLVVKKPAVNNKAKVVANHQQAKKVSSTNSSHSIPKKAVKHDEPIKNQKAEINKEKENKLKALISAQEKKEEEEKKKKENREKEREEERKNMKKDIEKKKLIKNQNEDFKIEWMGAIKNEDPIPEKNKEDMIPIINKPKSKTESKKKVDGSKKPQESLDKKTRLTRDQLKQMKKNVKKTKDIPVEIYLPKGVNPNKMATENPEKEVPLVQIELEKPEKDFLQIEKDSKESEEQLASDLEVHFPNDDLQENSEKSDEKTDFSKKEQALGNIEFLEDLEKDFLEIEKNEQIKKEIESEKTRKKTPEHAELEDDSKDENDFENMIAELTEIICNPDFSEIEKKNEINIEEINAKAENQEDRDDDPEDFEEFVDEKDKISKVPIQEECNSFSIIPEKNKIDSLRNSLKEDLGEETFLKAYNIIINELEKCDLDEIERKYGENSYKNLFPFFTEENIQTYLPVLFTLVIMEGRIPKTPCETNDGK